MITVEVENTINLFEVGIEVFLIEQIINDILVFFGKRSDVVLNGIKL